MKGRLLKGESNDKAFIFCRLLMLIGICTLLVFPVIFTLLIPGSVEIWWDRALMLLLAIAGLSLSYRPHIPLKKHYLNFYLLSGVFNLHILINAWYNNFEQNHFLLFLLVFVSTGLSYRYLKSGIWYIASIAGSAILFIFLSELTIGEQGRLVLWILLFSAMLYTLLLNKNLFVRSVKIRGELLRTIASKTEDALLLTNMDGFIKDYNERTTELFGYSNEELLKLDFNAFRFKELSDKETQKGLRILKQDRFWKDEVKLLRKDGTQFIGLVTATLIRKFGRENIVFRISDITQIKEAQAALISAKEDAESATRAKSLFLASMSHEIRTPMNGVIGMSDMLMKTELDEEQLLQVRTIKRSGENLMVILNDILDFSKIESGKMMMEDHEFDFREVMKELRGLFEYQAEDKNIKLNFLIAEDIPQKISADSNRLRQVISNLLSNAIKFTNEGSVELTVKRHTDSERYCHLFFQITDTGIGIPGEKQKQLFDAFTQVDSSTTRKFGGTGLGLSISKRLVELMGGKIEVESRLGEGATFTFDIKCREVDGSKAEAEKNNNGIELDQEKMKDLKILVAEDNHVNQQVIKLMLEKVGAEVSIVETGLEAVEAARQKQFDLIFMDVQMPEMDGLEATEVILKEIDKNAYIVAMTANVLSEDRDKCLEVGMTEFLGKPVLHESLMQRIDGYLSWRDKLIEAS